MKKMRLIVCSVVLTFLFNACGSVKETDSRSETTTTAVDDSWKNHMEMVETMEEDETVESKTMETAMILTEVAATNLGTTTQTEVISTLPAIVEVTSPTTMEQTAEETLANTTMAVEETVVTVAVSSTTVSTLNEEARIVSAEATAPLVNQTDTTKNSTVEEAELVPAEATAPQDNQAGVVANTTTEDVELAPADETAPMVSFSETKESSTTSEVELAPPPPNLWEIEFETGNVAEETSGGIATVSTTVNTTTVTTIITSTTKATTVTTTSTTSSTTQTTTTVQTHIKNPESVVKVRELPTGIENAVKKTKENYPNANIAVGLFDLETLTGYVYNPKQQISAGCSIKAAFALYVVKCCEEQDIDITKERITIKRSDYHGGSGVILPKLVKGEKEDRKTANLEASTTDSYLKYGDALTIDNLLTVLLGESDNMAYEMLYDRFNMKGFRKFLKDINGQTLYESSAINREGYQMFGSPDVYDRLNEWYAIYQYINEGCRYSNVLKKKLKGTKYCYIAGWMNSSHDYLHKSGWIEGRNSCASDCALLDGRYLLVVLMSDSKEDISSANEIRRIGSAAEAYLSTKYFQFD